MRSRKLIENYLENTILIGIPKRDPSFRKSMLVTHPNYLAYETLANDQQKYIYDRVGHEKMSNPNIQQEMNLATMKGENL